MGDSCFPGQGVIAVAFSGVMCAHRVAADLGKMVIYICIYIYIHYIISSNNPKLVKDLHNVDQTIAYDAVWWKTGFLFVLLGCHENCAGNYFSGKMEKSSEKMFRCQEYFYKHIEELTYIAKATKHHA